MKREFELYFGGAEVITWRKLLAAEGIPHIGINYLHLKPRLPKKEWLLADHFPPEQKIFLDAGSFGINNQHWDQAEHNAFLSEYMEFVQANLDRLSYFTECDFTNMGQDWVESRRNDVWLDLSPDKFIPVWHEQYGLGKLREMTERYPNLGVPPLTPRSETVVGGLVRRSRIALHGLCFNHPYSAPGGLYSTILSSSWISPQRYGETVVWDTNRLRRYPSDDKVKARRRHRSQFIRAGFDGDKIVADDKKEVTRYTLWAWRQVEQHMPAPQRVRLLNRPHVDSSIAANGTNHHVPESAPAVPEVVDIDLPTLHQNGSRLPVVQKTLPVFDFQTVQASVPNPDGSGPMEVAATVPVMGRQMLRQCDSCSLAGICPEFTPGSDCHYAIPIEIRTRPQLMGILYSLLELQGQRVAFGFFSEQLMGGYPDANLSSELDRFMRMTQSVKDIQDNRDFLKVTVEGKAEPGILRQLFGGKADNLHRVDSRAADDAVRRTLS